MTTQNNSEKDGCPICLEDYDSDDSNEIRLVCNHSICGHCLPQYLHTKIQRNWDCPLCRGRLFPASKMNFTITLGYRPFFETTQYLTIKNTSSGCLYFAFDDDPTKAIVKILILPNNQAMIFGFYNGNVYGAILAKNRGASSMFGNDQYLIAERIDSYSGDINAYTIPDVSRIQDLEIFNVRHLSYNIRFILRSKTTNEPLVCSYFGWAICSNKLRKSVKMIIQDYIISPSIESLSSCS